MMFKSIRLGQSPGIDRGKVQDVNLGHGEVAKEGIQSGRPEAGAAAPGRALKGRILCV